MIEINLLGDELKIKARGRKTGIGIGVNYLVFIALALICAHIYLSVLYIVKNNQYRMLNNKWHSLEPQIKLAQDFNKAYGAISEESQTIRRLTEQRINWAEKLNKLSLDLPSGIWFNELDASEKDFTLQGSVVSLKKDEWGLLKKLIDKLKSDRSFFHDFFSIDLNSAQKKTLGYYDVVDFILTMKINPVRTTWQNK